MNIIISDIPDGESCRGCRFLITMETSSMDRPDVRHCDVFNIAIKTNAEGTDHIKGNSCLEARVHYSAVRMYA